MNWPIIIAQLIVQFGIPATQQIIAMIQKVKEPGDLTDADWASLREITNTPYSAFVTKD